MTKPVLIPCCSCNVHKITPFCKTCNGTGKVWLVELPSDGIPALVLRNSKLGKKIATEEDIENMEE